MGLRVPPERQDELTALPSMELILLIISDRLDQELTIGEIRFIHDLGAQRLEDGDGEADLLLREVYPIYR